MRLADWKPLTDSPHDHHDGTVPLLLAVYARDDPRCRNVLYAHTSKCNSFMTNDGSWLTVSEQGWVPYAWRVADLPERDDTTFPPALHDYMTIPETGN